MTIATPIAMALVILGLVGGSAMALVAEDFRIRVAGIALVALSGFTMGVEVATTAVQDGVVIG